MTYKIVLVCVGQFQEYILTNLDFLIQLQSAETIVVLTERRFFSFFSSGSSSRIQLIAVEDLHDKFHYLNRTAKLVENTEYSWDPLFLHSGARFFYIHAYMEQYQVCNVIHIENDVLVYYDVSVLESYIGMAGNDKVYLPFDSYGRNVCSIMYIPTCEVLANVLGEYDIELFDMGNFIEIYKKHPEWIDSFPISVLGLSSGSSSGSCSGSCSSSGSSSDKELEFVCKNFYVFGGFIFDAAAIGQYLGGVDPANIAGDTAGFVNETCVVKYNQFRFDWKMVDGFYRPFMIVSCCSCSCSCFCSWGNILEFPIFNLHIHSKNLRHFLHL